MWSTIKKPGDINTDKAIACDCFRLAKGLDETKLVRSVSKKTLGEQPVDSLPQRCEKQQLAQND